MDLKILDESHQAEYDHLVTHVIQSWRWGQFRKSLGIPLLRYGLFDNNKMVKAFQISFHRIPLLIKPSLISKQEQPEKLTAILKNPLNRSLLNTTLYSILRLLKKNCLKICIKKPAITSGLLKKGALRSISATTPKDCKPT